MDKTFETEEIELTEAYPIEELATAYVDTYAGDPWFQNFDPKQTSESLSELLAQKGVHLKYAADDNGKIENFYLYFIGEPQEAIHHFSKIYPDIVSTPIGEIKPPKKEEIEEHLGILHSELESQIKDCKKVLYVIDVGIIPEKQGSLGPIGRVLKDIENSFTQEEGIEIVLAQTLSKGPMFSMLTRRMGASIIDKYPETRSDHQHLTVIVKQETFKNIKLRARSR